jgi:SAM-dependent methyltransferase
VVDIGGGNGELLRRLLAHRPALRGVLFDLPHVVERAGALRRHAGVDERIKLVGGDMFTDPLPEGGDVYVLSSVLHDWDDDDAHRVLVRCREAMPSGARLVLFESVLAQGPGWDLGKLVDLHMLVLFGAGERTEREWDDLLTRTGFTLTRIVPTPGLTWIEATPAAADR